MTAWAAIRSKAPYLPTINSVTPNSLICLVAHHLEKLSVRIDGPQLMDKPDGFVEVVFDALEVSAYEVQGKIQFTAKAASIKLAV